jgi:hypothetical protein
LYLTAGYFILYLTAEYFILYLTAGCGAPNTYKVWDENEEELFYALEGIILFKGQFTSRI